MISAVFETKIGNFAIEEENGEIRRLAATEASVRGELSPLGERAKNQLEEYFEGRRRIFDLPCAPAGTPFRTAVWRILQTVPYGETRSYRWVAEQIGNPKACRAVGGAIHDNPILIVIPCHRIVGADGSLTGFGAGIDLKERLLNLERGENL